MAYVYDTSYCMVVVRMIAELRMQKVACHMRRRIHVSYEEEDAESRDSVFLGHTEVRY